MNEFRNKVFGGEPTDTDLLRSKGAKSSVDHDRTADLSVPRTSARMSNHRHDDRHRLADQSALLLQGDRATSVTLVNLSGGGAMIEGCHHLKLWDHAELEVGPGGRLEAIVRWIKGQRCGLEFAHETKIDASPEIVASVLRTALELSFPDVSLPPSTDSVADAGAAANPICVPVPEAEPAEGSGGLHHREPRHPLIWKGEVHHNHESTEVRLRNISAGGALIECTKKFPLSAELLLDLGDAGSVFAHILWAKGDQLGLRFQTPFDLNSLSKARPEVTGSHWIVPDYLRRESGVASPWADRWQRLGIKELRATLAGFTGA